MGPEHQFKLEMNKKVGTTGYFFKNPSQLFVDMGQISCLFTWVKSADDSQLNFLLMTHEKTSACQLFVYMQLLTHIMHDIKIIKNFF